MNRIETVLEFWFGEGDVNGWSIETLRARTAFWFRRAPETDEILRTKFANDLTVVEAGAFRQWGETDQGLLAAVIVLDQFTRNLRRGTGAAFANDAVALDLSLEAISTGRHLAYPSVQRLFLYMPLMHAEDVSVQDRSVRLYRELHDSAPDQLKPEFEVVVSFADRHAEIVQRFGRYPHRNEAVGRASTAEEIAFLREPNSSF